MNQVYLKEIREGLSFSNISGFVMKNSTYPLKIKSNMIVQSVPLITFLTYHPERFFCVLKFFIPSSTVFARLDFSLSSFGGFF
jgi:hypothetical protein